MGPLCKIEYIRKKDNSTFYYNPYQNVNCQYQQYQQSIVGKYSRSFEWCIDSFGLFYMLRCSWFSANNRAFLAETEATGTYKNISLTGMEMYNFYSNQILELIQLPDGKIAVIGGNM